MLTDKCQSLCKVKIYFFLAVAGRYKKFTQMCKLFSLVAGSITMNIPGAESSYLEAFASAMGMVNGVLLLMRYSEQWYAWFATLVMYTILYTVSGSYIMLITVAAMFVPQ